MTGSKKIETFDYKVRQNKAQYNLDRQAAQKLALFSRNVGKYESLTSEDILQKKKSDRKCCYDQKILSIYQWVVSWKNKLTSQQNNRELNKVYGFDKEGNFRKLPKKDYKLYFATKFDFFSPQFYGKLGKLNKIKALKILQNKINQCSVRLIQ